MLNTDINLTFSSKEGNWVPQEKQQTQNPTLLLANNFDIIRAPKQFADVSCDALSYPVQHNVAKVLCLIQQTAARVAMGFLVDFIVVTLFPGHLKQFG